MNKKLFTLAAGLLLGSAFVVNAQTPGAALTVGAKVDGNTYYFIGDGTNFLQAHEVTVSGTKYTTVSTTAAASSSFTSTNVSNFLWKVVPSVDQGTSYIQLVNKATKAAASFEADGDFLTTAAPDVNKMIIDGVWGDVDKDGILEMPTGGTITIRTSAASETTKKYLSVSSTTVSPAGSGTSLKLYKIASTSITTTDALNSLMGGSFTFNFPDADPAPESNVFGQKLIAVNVPTSVPAPGSVTIKFGTVTASDKNMVVANDGTGTGSVAGEYSGTYFVVSAPDGAIAQADNNEYYFTSRRLFEQCKVVAVDPVNRYDINLFDRTEGDGFKFQTIDVEDLVITDTPEEKKTHVDNAHFSVSIPDAVNAKDCYLIKVAKPYVAQAEGAKPEAVSGDVKAMAYTTFGNSYVMTYSVATLGGGSLKNATFDAKLVSSKVIGATDLLKKDGPSVFNIMFTSNQDKLTKAGSSEYGKYLALSGATYLAQGPAYLDLDAPETQWVVTGFDGTYFTFTNREDVTKKLNLQLSKTDKENVYGVFAETTTNFNYAYVDSKDGYTKSAAKDLKTAGFEVKLVPATITPNAGYADLTKEDMADPIVMKFTTRNSFLVKELYVGVKKNAAGTAYVLTAVEDADDAAEWEITKFAAKADSIGSKIKYAYMKDKAVAESKDIVNTGITTYAFKWKNDAGVKAYLNTTNGALTLDETDKIAKAERQIIKVTKDGALLLFGAALNDNTYLTNVVGAATAALSIDNTGGITNAAQGIYSYGDMKSVLSFESVKEVSTSLESEPRHASFQSVNGGFLGMDENNNAIIAATQEEAKALTFWLDTTDVKELTTNFYISQAMPEGLKAAEPRMFLFNPADSVSYYDEGTASTTTDLNYLLSNKATTKAMFKAATLINKDSINTIIKDKEVGLNKDNGLNRFKFQIVEANEDGDEYAIKSGDNYLISINGKIGFGGVADALVVNLGEGDATANEAIAAEAGVQVIGGQGAVTVQGAAGKVVTVANILGQTIANQVAASDNVTIAAPAGIVVVAVEGEATKVVVK